MKKVICDHAGECDCSWCHHKVPHTADDDGECEKSSCLRLMMNSSTSVFAGCVPMNDNEVSP